MRRCQNGGEGYKHWDGDEPESSGFQGRPKDGEDVGDCHDCAKGADEDAEA